MNWERIKEHLRKIQDLAEMLEQHEFTGEKTLAASAQTRLNAAFADLVDALEDEMPKTPSVRPKRCAARNCFAPPMSTHAYCADCWSDLIVDQARALRGAQTHKDLADWYATKDDAEGQS